MDSDIEKTAKSYVSCIEAQKNPPQIVNSHWTDPEQLWSWIYADFAGPINGLSFLVVLDIHSKWSEIFPMKTIDTHSTITILKRLFHQHGLSETNVSDSGTQFTSELFRYFCRSSCITCVRAPPYHPQSNGQAERFEDIFKCGLLKAKGEGTTTEEILKAFLLSYRTTPNGAVKNGMLLAEALMGLKLCTTLDTLRLT